MKHLTYGASDYHGTRPCLPFHTYARLGYRIQLREREQQGWHPAWGVGWERLAVVLVVFLQALRVVPISVWLCLTVLCTVVLVGLIST